MHTKRKKNHSVIAFVVLVGLASIVLLGCTNAGTSTVTNTNSNSNTPIGNASTTPAPLSSLEAREPETYSVTNTITIQPTGNSPQANIPSLQFSFARTGTERRVSFKLPDPVGEVIYLEKPPMKYLVFPARNEYVELDPNELGFQLGEVMSPAAVVQRLKEKTQYEQLGTETINGRTAVKYRLRGAADTRTKVGTAQADSIVYVDQETGLPLRSEIETTSSSGAGARITTAADNIQFTTDPSLFQVPTTMKKVTTTELKQQVQSFVATVRAVASYLKDQASTPPPAAQQ
jgi:hypothetical protein